MIKASLPMLKYRDVNGVESVFGRGRYSFGVRYFSALCKTGDAGFILGKFGLSESSEGLL